MKLKKLFLSICALTTSISIASHYSFPLKASAEVNNQLNIRVYMDETMYHNFHDYLDSSNPVYGTYGVPSSFTTRVTNITTMASAVFSYYGININIISCTTPPLTTPAYYCIQDIYDSTSLSYTESMLASCFCRDGDTSSNSVCYNGHLHHTFIEQYADTLPSHSSSNECIALLTTSRICINNNGTHTYADGATNITDKIIIARDTDYVNNTDTNGSAYSFSRMVFTHEIGHLFNVQDHYNTITNTSSDNCIWGPNAYDEDVTNGCSICATCSETIRQNNNLYHHIS